MKIEKYNRKTFSVRAVQIRFDNISEVADWCNGTIVNQKAKMLGVETDVPAIQVDGQGDSRGKTFVATLGCYVVELKGSFRVYKPAQFDSSFEKFVETEQNVDVWTPEVLNENTTEIVDPIDEKVRLAEFDNSSVGDQETGYHVSL